MISLIPLPLDDDDDGDDDADDVLPASRLIHGSLPWK
jgi:hypothetical protein